MCFCLVVFKAEHFHMHTWGIVNSCFQHRLIIFLINLLMVWFFTWQNWWASNKWYIARLVLAKIQFARSQGKENRQSITSWTWKRETCLPFLLGKIFWWLIYDQNSFIFTQSFSDPWLTHKMPCKCHWWKVLNGSIWQHDACHTAAVIFWTSLLIYEQN